MTYEPGELTAIVYNHAGKEIARTSLKTAGEETKLTVLPEKETVRKGELLYVRLRYTDHEGTVKPLVRGEMHVDVQGGKLLALGNACSYNEKGYLTNCTDTYYGEALAIIQPNQSAFVSVQVQSRYGNETASIPVKV